MVSDSKDPRWWKPSWNPKEEVSFVLLLEPIESDIENFKWLFHIEDDGGIGGKCTYVQLIAINKDLSTC